MRRVIREGIDDSLIPLLQTYKAKPEAVKSSVISDFLANNWEFLQRPDVYFEYNRGQGQECLTVYLVNNQPVPENLSSVEGSFVDPCAEPNSTDLLGATTAWVLPGSESVLESRKQKGLKKMSEAFGFERRNADPRAILDQILKTGDVRRALEWKACKVRQVKNTTYKGVYDVHIECRHCSKPLIATVAVEPSIFEIYFSVAFYRDDNDWVTRDVEGDCEVDPERLGYAAKAFEQALSKALPMAQGY